jgi:dihydropteroate synthase
MAHFQLDCGGRPLALDRPRVMGVLNITPDSFSDGGKHLDPVAARSQAEAMVAAGADILDVGGESTRPGAEEVPVEEELDRVLPVIEAVAPLGVPVSIDTRKAEVMRAAVAAGAGMVNDVSALGHDPQALPAAAELGVPVVLMHMRGTPETMQQRTQYTDVVSEVSEYLLERAAVCQEAGIPAGNLILDAGIGFAKELRHNLQLLHHTGFLAGLGYPLLMGTSRKAVVGQILDRPVEERIYGTAATVAWSVAAGAHIVRVHDVAAMADVARMTAAIRDVER